MTARKRKAKAKPLVNPAVEDLQNLADQLGSIAVDLQDEGLLIAAHHCNDAIQDIEDHLWHLEQNR